MGKSIVLLSDFGFLWWYGQFQIDKKGSILKNKLFRVISRNSEKCKLLLRIDPSGITQAAKTKTKRRGNK